MALGGQGAPLAPIFHDLMFRSPKQARWVLNLGGIANLTGLVPGRATFGFDTGPANILMDAWTQRVQGQKYDRDGAWARGARLVPALLQDLLADPYFALAPPKSTGRELFNVDWLLARLKSHADLDPADVQRCLLELSVRSVSDAMAGAAVGVADGAGTQGELLVCGGGADNTFLMQRLAELNPRLRVARTEDMGVPGEAVEAMAFAVFAQKTLRGIEVDTPSITGASRACLLGTVYRP